MHDPIFVYSKFLSSENQLTSTKSTFIGQKPNLVVMEIGPLVNACALVTFLSVIKIPFFFVGVDL